MKALLPKKLSPHRGLKFYQFDVPCASAATLSWLLASATTPSSQEREHFEALASPSG